MNKKALCLVSMLLIIPILSALPASATPSQNKLSFELFFQGLPVGETIEAGNNILHKNFQYYVLGEFYVKIGVDGAVEDITKDYLEYSGVMSFVTHSNPEEFYTVIVKETILIYSSTTHNDETLRGTLEITATGTNRADNGGHFVGFGTDEFEGVKIKGTSLPLEVVGGNPNPPYIYTQLTRIGIVTSWP